MTATTRRPRTSPPKAPVRRRPAVAPAAAVRKERGNGAAKAAIKDPFLLALGERVRLLRARRGLTRKDRKSTRLNSSH